MRNRAQGRPSAVAAWTSGSLDELRSPGPRKNPVVPSISGSVIERPDWNDFKAGKARRWSRNREGECGKLGRVAHAIKDALTRSNQPRVNRWRACKHRAMTKRGIANSSQDSGNQTPLCPRSAENRPLTVSTASTTGQRQICAEERRTTFIRRLHAILAAADCRRRPARVRSNPLTDFRWSIAQHSRQCRHSKQQNSRH